MDNVKIEIDFWPCIPPFLEIEGPNEASIKAAAEKLGFNWGKAVFTSAGHVIEENYGIPVGDYTVFTFAEQK